MTRSTLTYPLTIENGRLKLSTEGTLDRDAIFSVIETRVGERVMRPLSYGTPDYVLETVDNPSVVPKRLEVAIIDQVPGVVECLADGRAADNGVQVVQIFWRSLEDEGTFAVKIAP